MPATLAKISLKGRECQPALVPFPCWSAQEEGNCGALQNVVDAFLDPQDVLWVLDTGVVNSLAEPIRRCSPKVVAINAKSGKVRYLFYFPSNSSSFFFLRRFTLLSSTLLPIHIIYQVGFNEPRSDWNEVKKKKNFTPTPRPLRVSLFLSLS